MRVVVDTNVFITGVFFTGPPHKILDAWRQARVELLLSTQILEEYQKTGDVLAKAYPGIDLDPWLRLVASRGRLVDAPPLAEQICEDPDDDKFLACAIAGRSKAVVSGDRALLKASGYKGVAVLTPRQFLDRHLTK